MSAANYESRSYRLKFNSTRFKGWLIKHPETNLWIGGDNDSYRNEMEQVALAKVIELRQMLDNWADKECGFGFSMLLFQPADKAPAKVRKRAAAAARANAGPMAGVAGLFVREVWEASLQNFSVKELVIENGGDIFAWVKNDLVLTFFKGKSSLPEKSGIVVPSGSGAIGICTSSGTVGLSVSFGKADAVAVVCRDVLLTNSLATATGNRVNHPDDTGKALEYAEMLPEILRAVLICKDKSGVRGEYEIKLLK